MKTLVEGKIAIDVVCCLLILELFLSGSLATERIRAGTDQPGWRWIERGNISLRHAGVLDVHASKEAPSIWAVFASTEDSVHILNSTVLEHFTPTLMRGELNDPKGAQNAGVFKLLNVAIADGISRDGERGGGIILFKKNRQGETEFEDLTSGEEDGSLSDYGLPMWLEEDAFITCRMKRRLRETSAWELVHFASQKFGKPWKGNTIKNSLCGFNSVLYKQVWEKWDALYTFNDKTKALNLLWPENNRGSPGKWSDAKQIKNVPFNGINDLVDVKLIDLNEDGRKELLMSLSGGNKEVKAYEIPESTDFKNPDTYREHLLSQNPSRFIGNKECPGVVTTFRPLAGKKPWILWSGGSCGYVHYLVPNSEDKNDWQYKRYSIMEGNEMVRGIAALDIDQDGWEEIFVSQQDFIKVLSFVGGTTTYSPSISTWEGTTNVIQNISLPSNTTAEWIPSDYAHTTPSGSSSNDDTTDSSSTTPPLIDDTTSILPSSASPPLIDDTTSLLPSSTTPPLIDDTTSIFPSSTTPPLIDDTTSLLPSSTTPQLIDDTTSLLPSSTTPPLIDDTTSLLPSSTTPPLIDDTTSLFPSSTTPPLIDDTTSILPSSASPPLLNGTTAFKNRDITSSSSMVLIFISLCIAILCILTDDLSL